MPDSGAREHRTTNKTRVPPCRLRACSNCSTATPAEPPSMTGRRPTRSRSQPATGRTSSMPMANTPNARPMSAFEPPSSCSTRRQDRKGESTDADGRRRRETAEHPRGVDTIDHAGGRHRPHGTGQTATARHPQPPTMPEWPTPASPPAHSRRRCRTDCGVGFSAWSVGS